MHCTELVDFEAEARSIAHIWTVSAGNMSVYDPSTHFLNILRLKNRANERISTTRYKSSRKDNTNDEF